MNNKKSQYQYPIVSHSEIIDLFHAILFWRFHQKAQRHVSKRFYYLTFDTFFKIIDMARILHKRRAKKIRGNKDLCKKFLKDTYVIEFYDSNPWEKILNSAGFNRFALRKSDREMVNGNSVNPLELTSRTRIFITSYGIRSGPLSVKKIKHLLTFKAFDSIWTRFTSSFSDRNLAVLGSVMRERNAVLDEEIWGTVPKIHNSTEP